MYKELFEANRELVNLLSSIDATDTSSTDNVISFLIWQKERNKLFLEETKPIVIPQRIFENRLSPFEYDKHSRVLGKYYYRREGAYIKKNIVIDNTDAIYLLRNMVLIAGKVVWVRFGYNVGREFRGFHPAVILKNIGECLLVAPLTSGAKDINNSKHIDISKVYGFELRDRYTDITRIVPASVYRVDLNNKIGNIPREKLTEIKSAIVNYWQDKVKFFL